MLNWIVIFQLFYITPLVFPANQHGIWTKYISDDDRFSISVPGEMQLNQSEIATSLGTLDHLTLYFKDSLESSDNYLYTVSYCDYPEGTFHPDSTELNKDFLNVTIEESVQAIAGELLYEDEIAIMGNIGRVWKASMDDGKSVVKNKALIAGDRYYCLQVFTLKSKSRNENADRFLDSFIIL